MSSLRNPLPIRDTAPISPPEPRLEIDLFQLCDDSFLHKNRGDGTGWDWGWADYQRDWMDASTQRFAYRCLPLTIANQTGLWIRNPVGFTAVWDGRGPSGGVSFQFDAAEALWKPWINDQFGGGIITWNTPLLMRTRPEGSRLLIVGPANVFKHNLHPLTALIESDWMTMSFTMNWKIMTPGQPVRFDFGEPLFQAIPLARNIGADIENASVTFCKLDDDPAIATAYREWSSGRQKFHKSKYAGEVKPGEWQKDYFQGRDPSQGRVAGHMTKIKPPEIQMGPRTNPIEAMPRCPVTLANKPATAEPVAIVAPAPRMAPALRSDRRLPRKPLRRPSSLDSAVEATPPAAEVTQAQVSGIEDHWKSWIVENLLLGNPPEALLAAMTRNGVNPVAAAREIELILKGPYLPGAERLKNRLKKRDWILQTYRKLDRMRSKSTEVEVRHRPSRDEFFRDFYAANRPVRITGMFDDWPALKRWSLDDFATRFGDRPIEVQVGRNADARYEVERERFRSTITMGEYVDRLRMSGRTNDVYLTANNNSKNKDVLPELWDDIRPIDEYLDSKREARAGFFWLGPAGTITPFHHDLTNNFMAQVLGRKRVKLVPTWDIPLMRNELHCFSSLDGGKLPASTPDALDAPQILECILNPGELLFLPIGCMHYVESLDISATMSFTNFVFDNDFTSFYSTYHQS